MVDHVKNRPWAFLSTSVSSFEKSLKYLKKNGYQPITLKELYEWKQKGQEDDVKRVLIHFDDGFLDNYAIVYPMLKKYEFKATVFVSPDFVDPRPIMRETQYNNIITGQQVNLSDVWGYMSWPELQQVDREGIIDVQAHAMTHTWYPCEARLMDWHSPNDSYYWLSWNLYPEKKPYWLTEYNETDVPYGYPVFKYAKSISGKRFIPRQEVIDDSIQYYLVHHREWNADNKAEIVQQFNQELNSRYHGDLGRFESDSEFHDRLRVELIESKHIIESNLGKKIEFLAWPGGAVCEQAYEIAKQAGYLSWTKKGKPYNELNDPLTDVYRLGGWSGIRIKNRPVDIIEHYFLMMQLHRAKGSKSILNRGYALIGNLHRKRHIRKCQKRGENWK